MNTLLFQFFSFMVYSILGYISELIFCSALSKKIVVDRGFLIGPYCPIYGIGAVLISHFLTKFDKSPIVIFVMGAVIATIIEYLSSYILEKIFKVRWWDYSQKSFNINGRVCLKISVLFGIGALIVIYIGNNLIYKLATILPPIVFNVINIILLVIFIIDIIISNKLIFEISSNAELIKGDMTNEIKEQVKREIKKNFTLKKRLLNSYPNIFKEIRGYIKKQEKLNKERKEAKKKKKNK